MALNLLARKRIRAGQLGTHRFALGEINEAFEAADSGADLKVVIII